MKDFIIDIQRSPKIAEAELKFSLLYTQESLNPLSTLEKNEIKSELIKMLEMLTPREKKVIIFRFGIDIPSHTLSETDIQFEVTRERIRQIEAKAIRKLRHPSRNTYFKEE